MTLDILRAIVGNVTSNSQLKIAIESLKDVHAILSDAFKGIFDNSKFVLLTQPICENEHSGPIRSLVKKGPEFIKEVLTGRWRPIRTKILCSLFLTVKKLYVNLVPYTKLVKLYLNFFPRIILATLKLIVKLNVFNKVKALTSELTTLGMNSMTTNSLNHDSSA
ncbi:hypothetical protein C0J52_12474 [Blattella germanica]|nr:hypothetical protein C0J52_12474 [Blattella germanica]